MALKKVLDFVGALVLLAGAIALVRDTACNGHDFVVFWTAGQSLWRGEAIYSVARDGAMVFKYPPWIVPLFVPLAWIPLDFAKWIWGVLEVLSLIGVVRWVARVLDAGRLAIGATLVGFWGIWAVHALDGQIALPLLAIALASWHPDAFERIGWRSVALVGSLSTKIFTAFPLVSFVGTRRAIRNMLFTALFLLLLAIPALRASHGPAELIHAWSEAAASGGKLFEAQKIRGRGNPSLPALALRILDVPPANSLADVIAFALCALVLGAIWWRVSRRLRAEVRWIGWLALTPIVHPLAWFHLFVFAFPVATVALDQALKRRRALPVLLASLGIFLIGAATEKTLGSVGLWLELASAKSWGTLLCLALISNDVAAE